MAIPIAPTPTLRGKEAVHFLKRVQEWEKNKVELTFPEIDHVALDRAVEEIKASRKKKGGTE